MLQIYHNIKNVFQEKPLVASRRNKNLQDLIGGNTILKNKGVWNYKSIGSSLRDMVANAATTSLKQHTLKIQKQANSIPIVK